MATFLFSIPIIALEQIIKALIIKTNYPHQINSGISYSLNYNANFANFILGAVSLIVIIAIYLKQKRGSLTKLTQTGWIFLISGGISNLIDRINVHGVIDYIYISWFPVFNLADVFITLGIILLITQKLFYERFKPQPHHHP